MRTRQILPMISITAQVPVPVTVTVRAPSPVPVPVPVPVPLPVERQGRSLHGFALNTKYNIVELIWYRLGPALVNDTSIGRVHMGPVVPVLVLDDVSTDRV